jgi:ABC-2 type transport system permease protein/sodium transport system permease protein
MLRQLRLLPLGWLLVSMAIAPGVFEELFFRGYLFRALRANTRSARATIGVSALLFGAFHVVAGLGLAPERFLSSTLLGVVLGWVCWRTGSVLPGILLHVCHNGLLLTISYYQPWLSNRGWDLREQWHLPGTWLLAASVVALLGILWIAWLKPEGDSGP